MKVTYFTVLALFLSALAQAEEAWEVCLDKRDFTFSADNFTRPTRRFTKTGCTLTLVELGTPGKKFELNVCDPLVHLDVYTALDSPQKNRYFAGSSGCPAPMFGADFNMPVEQKGAAEFIAARKIALDIAETVRKTMAPKITARDVERLKSSPAYDSDAQVACGMYLITEHLENCQAFEAPKPAVSTKNSKR